jgi:hypothetical protein
MRDGRRELTSRAGPGLLRGRMPPGRWSVGFLAALAGAVLVGAFLGLKATPLAGDEQKASRAGRARTAPATQGGAPARAVPRILASNTGTQLTPGQPGYDPAHLARFAGVEALFQQERRDPAWAAPLERSIPALAERDTVRILGSFRVTSVECRTTICRLTWEVSPEMAKRAKEVIRFLVPGSTGGLRGTPPVYYFALAGAANPWYRDVPSGDGQATLTALRTGRREMLRKLRTGNHRFQVPEGIPPEAWPTE